MTVGEVLAQATRTLHAAGIDGAPRDARALVAGAMGVEASRLTLLARDDFPDTAMAGLDRMLAERCARRPVSKILGTRLFWGRSFAVTEDVLDPRPETENIIEQSLTERCSSILDLGAGSGILAVTLLAEWPDARAVASDISAKALDVAAQNATSHGVLDRLTLLTADWFDGISGRFDLIVSNPPYIAVNEMPDLSPEVRNHDPEIALTPGGDGLAPYRVIATRAADHLTPGGRLLVEIGWQQGPAVAEIFRSCGLRHVIVHPDMDGRPRVVSCRGN